MKNTIAQKIQHKSWLQAEIIRLELESSPARYIELCKADLVRIENEIYDLAKVA